MKPCGCGGGAMARNLNLRLKDPGGDGGLSGWIGPKVIQYGRPKAGRAGAIWQKCLISTKNGAENVTGVFFVSQAS